MDPKKQISEQSQPKQECPECLGMGKIRTGGCTLEHGITTTCEEYGCPPIEWITRPVCEGTGHIK